MGADIMPTVYKRMLNATGENVVFRRYTGTGQSREKTDVTVLARVIASSPQELAGSLTQGDRKLIVLASDFDNTNWPIPPRKNDKVVVRGKELNIETVDDNTRRCNGVLVAYEIMVRG